MFSGGVEDLALILEYHCQLSKQLTVFYVFTISGYHTCCRTKRYSTISIYVRVKKEFGQGVKMEGW
jgi:hypothetical protein